MILMNWKFVLNLNLSRGIFFKQVYFSFAHKKFNNFASINN